MFDNSKETRMEESTVSGNNNSSTARTPALMKYDDVVLNFAEARRQYKDSILKYRDLIKDRELSTLKKLTYADVHQLVPDVEKNIVPQLGDQNEKRKQIAEETKLKENFEDKNKFVHKELDMLSRILQRLEKEKERLS